MQKISNDINANTQSGIKQNIVSGATDAIKNGGENLINVLNFSRRNLNNVTIIKKA